MIERTFSSSKAEPNNGVPLRSENFALQGFGSAASATAGSTHNDRMTTGFRPRIVCRLISACKLRRAWPSVPGG